MEKKYCDQCGKELDASAQFCHACGASVTYTQEESETVGAKLDGMIEKVKSDNGSVLNIKTLAIVVFVLIVILLVAVALTGGGLNLGSALVDVTDVTLSHKYFYATTTSGQSSDERPIKGTIEFTFMPKDYIERVTGIGLQNIVITYDDGQTQNAGYGVFNGHENVYSPNREYSFNMNYVVDLYPSADDNINQYFRTTHVKAEIVVNTTSETNKVIGYIDSDVVPPSK